MQTENIKVAPKPASGVFSQRLDFYWQSIAIYAVVIIIYGLFKGSLDNGTVTLVLLDPVVILLTVFIVASAVGLMFNFYKNRTIIIGKDHIIFKTRFHQKKYTASDISRISFTRERVVRIQRRFRVIKIKVNNRRRPIRIRPSSFWNENELLRCVVQLKKNLNR